MIKQFIQKDLQISNKFAKSWSLIIVKCACKERKDQLSPFFNTDFKKMPSEDEKVAQLIIPFFGGRNNLAICSHLLTQ